MTDNVADKPVLAPGPDHPITVVPTAGRVVVTLAGHTVASSTNALTLQESTYDAVQYIPREDVDLSLLERSDNESYCPYKGDAGYFSIRAGETLAENAIWTYEAPYDAVAQIKDHVAFYPDRVDSIEVIPA
jgi:uncharacterized protein (DUF427 family)